MALDARPPLGEAELAAIRAALTRAGLELGGQPAVYTSNWRRAALREAAGDRTDRDPEPEPQAFSPRRTRGATRA